jgi:nitrate reductase (cytochrome), electron transfer subunit
MASVNRSPYVSIGLAIVLMAALVVVVGQGLTAGERPARVPPVEAAVTPSLPSEAGMYRRAGRQLDYAAMPTEPNRARTLAVFYARRAYPGAPPIIPHAVDDRDTSGRPCLACHARGGWVPRFNAFSPVTPHPELTACRECHVRETSPGVAQATGRQTMTPPALRRAAMPGSPPPIPHDLEMRETCVACHAGPGAVAEIRTSHPERVSCRQCHALGAQPAEVFTRPLDGGDK